MALEASPECSLVVVNVATAYGQKKVLQDVSFQVKRGEVFGLIGLNGAGKTTLIRSILGLRPAEGTIHLFGESNLHAVSRRHLIYLPEKFQPSSQLSGWEYLSILLAYFGQKVDREAARNTARLLDLEPEVIGRRVRTYSKGMGQKLGLLGIFLAQTPLMILDEPMSGLDPRARALLKDRLVASKETGRSIFFSSHILADIEEICDRIAILHRGLIIFMGTPKDLVKRFASSSLERAFLCALDEHDRSSISGGAG